MQKSYEIRLQKKYPGLWSLLNNKAQQKLPKGIIEYLTLPNYKRRSWNALQIPEKYINDLIMVCGIKNVVDTYRRDLSSVGDENGFMNILHEIVLCASLAMLTTDIKLHPQSGKGKCDFSLPIEGIKVYGEVKRWPDNWWKEIKKVKSRLIFKTLADEIHSNTSNPRSMELYGKLIDATRQFSEGNINILFIFTKSFGEELRQLQQALFGDINYFREPDKVTLEDDGFFATTEGRVVSACYLSSIDSELFVFPRYWKNSNASVPMPMLVESLFKRYAWKTYSGNKYP